MATTTRRWRVVVCEDHAALREALCAVFLGAGHSVDAVSSAESCIGHCIVSRPDVLVLDLTLPDRGGIEVLQTLRCDVRLCDLRVIVLSGAEERKREALAAGADAFLLKPASAEDLIAAVEHVHAADEPIRRASVDEPRRYC